MKHTFLFRSSWVVLSSLLLFLPACATTPRAEVPGTLKVQVNVPASWNILLEDHVADNFVDQLRETFYRAGFDRPIEKLSYIEDPAKVPDLLTINLTEWRMDRVGNIECTFHADLQTPRGTRDFGLFSNMTMRWLTGPGRFGLSQAFTEAADGALRDLCNAVMKSEMLPDFRQPEIISSLHRNHSPST